LHNNTLTHLNLPCNNIGAAGLRSLSKALTNNTSLKRLDISHKLEGGVKYLSEALQENRTLKSLYIFGPLEIEYLRMLAYSIVLNRTITKIALSFSQQYYHLIKKQLVLNGEISVANYWVERYYELRVNRQETVAEILCCLAFSELPVELAYILTTYALYWSLAHRKFAKARKVLLEKDALLVMLDKREL